MKGVCIFKKNFFFGLDWWQTLKSFHFTCWKGHARLNWTEQQSNQPVSCLNVANPVKWQHSSSLLLSLMFFFNLAPSFHLPPTFTQLLRGLTCCWKRWNDIFEQFWDERAQDGALQPSTIIGHFTMTTSLSQLQFNKAKPKSGGKKEDKQRCLWHLHLKQYSLPPFSDTVCPCKRTRMLKHHGKALCVSKLLQSHPCYSLHSLLQPLLFFQEDINQLLDAITLPVDGQEVQFWEKMAATDEWRQMPTEWVRWKK